MTGSSVDGEELEELVAEALERQTRGEALRLDELCGGRADLVAAVEDTLGLAVTTPRLHGKGAARDPLVGSVLGGRFVLSECIGVGAMGVVYKGDDLELGRSVAVKVLRTDALDDAEYADRLIREGDVLAALNHPAVVTVHDRGRTEDGRTYLVMEYLSGVPLHEMLDRQLNIREIVQWIADLARGLQAAHDAGVYHRDIKPSNIIVGDAGPVLIDFGIAARDTHATLARGEHGLGTPAYMAPEQLDPGAPARATTDVYGLTATLFHGLTASPPYDGTASQILAAIGRQQPKSPARLRPGLPRDLLAILDRGLARNPQQRYQSARDLGDDLIAFLNHAPVKARYPGPVERLWRAGKRSPMARATTAVALVTALLIVAAFVYQDVARARLEAQQTEWQQTWGRAEPLLALWNAKDRVFADPDHRRETRELLDRAAATCLEPLPTLIVRAAFLFDHDERELAARDVARIAAETGSQVAALLAKRYASAVSDPSTTAIDVSDAPEPTTCEDAYLLAFHEIRRGKVGAAIEWLGHSLLTGYPPAIELLLTTRIAALPSDTKPRVAAARQIYEAIVRLEERYGTRTAMTAHLTGGALLGQGRYAEAKAAIQAGLELAPRSAALDTNMGIVGRRLGDLELGLRHLERAITSRPNAPAAYETLAWIYRCMARLGDERGFDLAKETEERAPLSRAKRLKLQAELGFDMALMHWQSGARTEAATTAREALKKWSAAGRGNDFQSAFAEKIARGEDPFHDAVLFAAETPEEWWKVLTVLHLMPDAVNTKDTAALQKLLHALVLHMAPEIRLTMWPLPEAETPR